MGLHSHDKQKPGVSLSTGTGPWLNAAGRMIVKKRPRVRRGGILGVKALRFARNTKSGLVYSKAVSVLQEENQKYVRLFFAPFRIS